MRIPGRPQNTTKRLLYILLLYSKLLSMFTIKHLKADCSYGLFLA